MIASEKPTPCGVQITRRNLAGGTAAATALIVTGIVPPVSWADANAQSESPEAPPRPKFSRLDSGLKVLVLREGVVNGATPTTGDQVEVHYYARLAAKQGWTFGSSYKNLDKFGAPVPFQFTVGDANVIEGLSLAVQSMCAGSSLRVVVPGHLGYQNKKQQPVPLEFSDRQRLYTTIFNPTRIANGEGDTLGTVVFDLELMSVRPAAK
eukprot:CAMPEP_0198199346 /NCGR_PEP_ID=MMETSP1445-20131203/2660_1 /TAXON_ID=36898 /ORGANISM="Pyramimonas sp., Strain CCMP2087" /LENGTH=207 /DNA_ID=CAMNT_0043869171 /DNA_START=200 /DNA_END=823 /DNA_ORIENTATION=+